ncbi:RNA polymerase sigma factor [Bacillus sp. FJAT-28004]|uniref:RNA polymerase sigma factor n=1 Tax=Bacillus sp. FJAT-28004 TaxID=1679165 RepID=UPI0006B41A7E|nr:RNA polymerase sigma factor [Bacillus sp. FJAT-28004]
MEQEAADLNDLYAAHSVYLNKSMYYLTRNREEAADLVQEAFLRLCLQDSLPHNPKSWLSQTGYRLFIDKWRRTKRVSFLPIDYYTVSSQTTPEQAVLDMEFERLVYQLLLRFKPRMRTALYLRIYKQFSYEEIASLLDCSENTVKSYIRRGRAQLSKWL